MNSLKLLRCASGLKQLRTFTNTAALNRNRGGGGGGFLTKFNPFRPATTTSTSNLPAFYDDDFMGLASNLMRNLDREFDAVRSRMMDSIGTMNRGMFDDLSITPNDFITTDKDGNRKFELNFNLQGFSPEEIKVKTEGRHLVVQAKKEQSSKDQYFLREFSQAYMLPEDVKLEDLKSKFTNDNILTIKAPLPKQMESGQKQGERTIQIEHGNGGGRQQLEGQQSSGQQDEHKETRSRKNKDETKEKMAM
jgi:HSP20 family molecular chaperone IbpA